VHPVAEPEEDDGLKAGAAARVERPPPPAVGTAQLGGEDGVEDGVEMRIPGLELLVIIGHAVEKPCGGAGHDASLTEAEWT
jgi:hypothetical protein